MTDGGTLKPGLGRGPKSDHLRTWIDIVQHHAEHFPDDLALKFLVDGETKEECAAASSAAAEAGKAAAREEDEDEEDDEEDDDEYPSIEARAAGYLVVTCAVVFLAIVAPFAAYANHLKRKGEDVCDRMPEWTREYVPRSLRPAGRAYDRFRGDLDVDDL